MRLESNDVRISTKARRSHDNSFVMELYHGERGRLLCPASMGKTCVYVSVTANGKLLIEGDSSIIEKISGVGMQRKVEDLISRGRR